MNKMLKLLVAQLGLTALEPEIRRTKEFWRTFRRNKLSVLGLILTCTFGLIALFAPYIAPYSPTALDFPPFLTPFSNNMLGTDFLGRDVFSQVIYGSRVSLLVGFLSTLETLAIGLIIGGIAGYFGGTVDELLMRITDIFLILPRLILAMVLASFFSANLWIIMFVIAITCWPEIARVVRAELLSLKERAFTVAAKAVGKSDLAILFTEILPNALSPVVVITTFQVGRSILLEAELSFLGLGDPAWMSWGYMVNAGRGYILTHWWITFFPGLMIFILVLALNVVGDGLNEVINPKLRRMR